MRMRWADVQAVHWRVAPRKLRRLVPPPLGLDLHDGEAWVSAVAQRTQATRLGPLPVGPQDYPQVNVRTYVRLGARAGIFLLRTACPEPAACAAARLGGLPYVQEPVRVGPGRAEVPGSGFDARWRPGAVADGGLDRFLLERRSLFARTERLLLRFDAMHRPWAVRSASATVEDGGLLPTILAGRPPDLAHAAEDAEATLARPGWRFA